MQDITTIDKFAGSWEVGEARMTLIKKTYAFLGLSVVAAISGAYFAMTVEPIREFLNRGIMGWIIAMVLLNAIPMIAMACRHNPILGFAALMLDGFVSGIILGPIVYYVCVSLGQPDIAYMAFGLTFMVFAAVTFSVWISGKSYSAPKGLMIGMFMSIIGAIILSFVFPMGIFGIIISAIIGIFGVLILVFATSSIIHDDSLDSPIPGALMLFAGLFNVFTAIIHLLMAFSGRD
ncbi:MAG: Bax inhibitor-1 family protein [Lentisphaeria bacterium]|nr:Bax inhibitor-1 family protein [Lentisphaeria bacterium]NQZ66554.1 Bax inhibitor-1 family protein [Lentisphaeria bacterium]